MKNKIYLGWDIGGANTKITVFDLNFNVVEFHIKNLQIWSNFSEIISLFKNISEIYKSYDIYNFITITAESCDNFQSRRSGILQILEYCNSYISGKKKYYCNNDTYVNYENAIKFPDKLCSTNWILTSKFLNKTSNINFIVDIGSTTTDYIYKNMSIKDNINDHKRLINKTLLYLGVIRTPIPMLANEVKFCDKYISLINEVFATTGDIFNITNDIDFTNLEYIGADNLELTKENSFIRLSRLLGKDFNESDKNYLIDVSFDLKRLFIKKIFNNLNSITKDKNKDLVMASIGEGNFLMKELCELYNIKYVSIENESFLSINNVKRDLVYKNFTSALVVNNYINKKL